MNGAEWAGVVSWMAREREEARVGRVGNIFFFVPSWNLDVSPLSFVLVLWWRKRFWGRDTGNSNRESSEVDLSAEPRSVEIKSNFDALFGRLGTARCFRPDGRTVRAVFPPLPSSVCSRKIGARKGLRRTTTSVWTLAGLEDGVTNETSSHLGFRPFLEEDGPLD